MKKGRRLNVIYGVSGEGSGHSSRSKEIISYLVKKHNVRVITYGKAYDYLKRYFKVTRIYGLHLSFKDNKIGYVDTIRKNLSNLIVSGKHFKALKTLLRTFKPEIAFTDFEPTAYVISRIYHTPLVSLDNQHRITNMDLEIPKPYKKDFNICKLIINAMIPKAEYYLVTSFFKEKIKKKNTFIFDPILRKEVRRLKPSKKDHVLVYQTSTSNAKLLGELKKVKQNFVIYGFGKKKNDANLTFKPFSTHGFLNDLASCKAVITNGGFTLITEAIYLKKPILSQPIHGQFEQLINAHYLQKLGYGAHVDDVTAHDIEVFLHDLNVYEKNLKNEKRTDTGAILKKIDGILKA